MKQSLSTFYSLHTHKQKFKAKLLHTDIQIVYTNL